MTNSIAELDNMQARDAIFAIGTNTTECHPIIGLKMLQAKARGAALIVADPRAIDLTHQADVWLRLKPGTDTALLNGLAHVIWQEGLADDAFIASRTENSAALQQAILPYTPEYTAAITTVPAALIVKAARLLAAANQAAFYYTMGITQHTSGVSNVWGVSNLALLTGNLGRAKTGVNPLRGQNNVQGSCDMGALPNVLPGYQSVSDAAARAKFETAWQTQLPAEPGLTIPQVLTAIEEHKVRFLYVFGENPMRSDPDINHVQHCLEHVDFLVVQDIFLTETAALADVVLPGASFAEKDGTFSSTERRVQRIRAAVPPVGNSRPDWQIFADLLQRLQVAGRHDSPAAVFAEMSELTPSHRGMSYARLEEGGLQWPCPTPDHPGTPILHVGCCQRGLGKFMPLSHKGPAELPDEEYPLILTTGRVVAHYHTGTMTRRSWGLNGACPEERLELHPQDAARLGIADGDWVRVTSRRGTLTTAVQLTERVPAGVTFMTFHFTESPGNILTNSAADPIAGTPEFKVCAVRVEKLAAPVIQEENVL